MITDLKPLPPAEAIAYFRSKGFSPPGQRFDYRDHWREDHARNFVVAKAMGDDILAAIREEFDRALSEGRTIDQFRADLKPRLIALGWWGRGLQRDPLTGALEDVQLGSMRRLRVIFDTNMRTAHAAGQWSRIQRTKAAFPYLQYIQIERPTKRHDHARFHDKIWRVDDPIWRRIYPPNGYFCGCIVIQRTERWMQRNGRTVSPPMDLDEEPWTNKRTGEVQMVPAGVNPGFDGNPGIAWLDTRRAVDIAMADLTSDQQAVQRGLIDGLRVRRLGTGREGLVVLSSSGEPLGSFEATPERPAEIPLPGFDPVPGSILLHSHITEGSLSADDLDVLFSKSAGAITSISPGGSIWRARRVPMTDLRQPLGEFASLIGEFGSELSANPDGAEIFYHARLLWLEKKGVITYHFSMSERTRQIMARNADLIRRLTDAIP